ncbi:MAG: SH3 domain-containing protein [Anaerolineae bacterium]|nr:SH3 domain-containing protein [Anaerolineae bacterium]
MGNKVYQPFVIAIWPVLCLAVSCLTACSPAEIPPTPTPVAIEVTATPTDTTAVATTPLATSTAPPTTPTSSPTTTPTTPAAEALIRQGDTLPSGSPTASPTSGTPSAASGVACVVSSDTVQLRSGPDANYASIRTLAAGTVLSAIKIYEADDIWVLVETRQKESGWIDASAAFCQSNVSRLPRAEGVDGPTPTASPLAVVTTAVPIATAVPVPTAMDMPTASPTLPVPSLGSWRGEYYDNLSLDGEPVLVRDDPALDFNWGADSPGPNVPADYFSVRWTRPFEFTEEGDYRFMADVDDGVKLYLDGWLIIDEWNTNPYVLHSGAFGDIKPGIHTLIVEYFEEAGDAHAKVWFEKTLVSYDNWVGEYYNNPDFQGAPFLVREDEDVDFDWDNDEPVSGMNDDYFSVRWQKTVKLKEGDYEFRAKLDEEDRVRIYLDNWLVFGEDSDNGGTSKGSFDDVGEGNHTITVEYQDFGGDARIEVDWDRR